MKKVCILQNSLNYGGTDTFVINLCEGLVKDGYAVTVVLSIDEDVTGPRLHDLQATGAHLVWTCSLNNTKAKIRHLLLLYKELKRTKYDVFQTNIDLFNGPNMFIAWLAGVPIRECHSHNSQQGKELRSGRKLSVRLYQGIMRWLCWKFSNRRCGCSEDALEFLFGDKWKNDSRVRVIPNGIDLSVYQGKFNKNKKKSELKLTNTYNICTVGRISYQKNPEYLLEVFYELSQIRKDVDLIWCGTGDLEELIREKMSKLNLDKRVHLLGARNDIAEILKCSDAFLLPSRFEGLGIVLIEAQAANLPCVMSDVVPKEVDCGLCLALPLEKSPKYWADQVCKVLDGKLSFEIDKNKLNEYSIDNMVKTMEEVFK